MIEEPGRPVYYKLDGKDIVPVADVMEWAKEFEKNRIVRQTERNGILVSTVFLGIDHGWMSEGPPIVFETMIFHRGDNGDGYQERCATYDEAIEQHEKACLAAFGKNG